MRLRYAVPIVLALAALVPAAAPGAACPPQECGPEGLAVAGGTAFAVSVRGATSVYDLASGSLRASLHGAVIAPDGRRAVAQEGALLRTVDLATGRTVATARVGSGWTLAGTSKDAARPVLFAMGNGATRSSIRGGATQRTLSFP